MLGAGSSASGTRPRASEGRLRGRRLRPGGRARQRRAVATRARRAPRDRLGLPHLARARRLGGGARGARRGAGGGRLERRRGVHGGVSGRHPPDRQPASGARWAGRGGGSGAGPRSPRSDRASLRPRASPASRPSTPGRWSSRWASRPPSGRRCARLSRASSRRGLPSASSLGQAAATVARPHSSPSRSKVSTTASTTGSNAAAGQTKTSSCSIRPARAPCSQGSSACVSTVCA
jgi:hypothetical protein